MTFTKWLVALLYTGQRTKNNAAGRGMASGCSQPIHTHVAHLVETVLQVDYSGVEVTPSW